MNKLIYEDVIGFNERNSGPLLDNYQSIPTPLRKAFIQRFGPDCRLTPIQIDAIQAGICDPSSHFIVSAPTNSGKTLVALFRIFSDLINKRGRCVYAAPLKALAEEKRVELEELSKMVELAGGPRIRLIITTGDYQLTGDFMGSPPPENGELIICTPERLEILLRSDETIFWARGVSTFVLDEFHLLSDSKRGATMEILVTRILASCPWSKIVALSATMGGLDAVGKWFGIRDVPVHILENDWRYPSLKRSVVSTNDKESFIMELADSVLADENRSLLVFVKQKRDAEQVAKNLQKRFGEYKASISFIHAGLMLKERSERLYDLRVGQKRVIVTTTALKMGIDAPVTDVLVYDTFLWGQKGRSMLSYSDLLQMTGRAGRRNLPGNAYILVDNEHEKTIENLFITAEVDPLTPQLINEKSINHDSEKPDPILSILLSEISVQKGTTLSRLNEYIGHTFSCTYLGPVDCLKQINELIRLKIAYKDEDDPERIYPTKLGKTISSTGMSPESGAILAGFLRALIKLDQKYEEHKGRRFDYLRRLTDLDLIFLCSASYECRDAWLKSPSKKDIADVQEFIETLPPDEKPIVNLWRDEASSEYPTRRLLTSLKIPFEGEKKGHAEKTFYRLMRTSVLLYQHARGIPLARLATKFKSSQGELENNLKFSILWILNCLSQICNGKRCYKFDFLMMKALKLIECIAVGSELGELLTIKGIGRNTVNKLIDSGINSFDQLSEISLEMFIDYGIKNRQALLLNKWLKSRFR